MAMRRSLLGALTAALVLGTAAASGPARSESYDLRFAEIGSPRGPRAEALQWWADELAARSNGQIKVEIFWGGALVSAKEVLQAVGTGLADAGTVVGSYTPAQTPIWALTGTPFVFDDTWVGLRAAYEARQTIPAFDAETLDANVKILANNSTGPIQLVSKMPLVEVEDLRGKKIRATGGWSELFEQLGAVSVNVSGAEAYQALDRGTIDASIYSVPLIHSYKLHEVAGHVTIADLGQSLAYGIGINLDLWNEMSPELQEILSQTSLDYMDHFAMLYMEDERQAREAMQSGADGHKVVFHDLTDDQKAAWSAPAKLLIEEFVAEMDERGHDGDAIFQEFYRLRDKYEQERDSKGYPWER